MASPACTVSHTLFDQLLPSRRSIHNEPNVAVSAPTIPALARCGTTLGAGRDSASRSSARRRRGPTRRVAGSRTSDRMGARSGQEYVQALNARATRVEIEGRQYTGRVAEIPQLRNVIQTYASLFDLQHDPAHRDVMTYASPTSGERVGMSFLQPRSVDDVVRRRAAMSVWAEYALGNLGRTGDYCNSAVMAMAGAAEWFGQDDPAYAENVRRYYEHIRENDLLLTHTLVLPQANRSLGPSKQKHQTLAARIVDRNDNGIVIRGARILATIGPFADEILVMPSTVLKGTEDDAPYSYAFALPCDAPGVRFLCRESFDLGRSHFDHPLGVALRGDRRDRGVRRRPRPVRALLHRRATRALQRHLHRDERRRAHDPPGRRADEGEDRVHPGARIAAHRGDRDRAVPARAGEDRRGDHRARDVRGPPARGRGGCGAEPVRAVHAGLGPAQRVPELVPADVPAASRRSCVSSGPAA